MEYSRLISQLGEQIKVETTTNPWQAIRWMIESFNSENWYIGYASDCVFYCLDRLIDIRYHKLLNYGVSCDKYDLNEREFIEDSKLLIGSEQTKNHASSIVNWLSGLYYSEVVQHIMRASHGFTAKNIWWAIFIYYKDGDYYRALSYLRSLNRNGDTNIFENYKSALDCFINNNEMRSIPLYVKDAFCYFYIEIKS